MKNNNKQFISAIKQNHNNTICRLIFCSILLGISVQSANAASYGYRNNSSTAYISMGQANVKANELVIGQPSSYPVDYKLSHLIWETRNVTMLTVGLNIPFEKKISLNIEGKFGITKGNGVMDDYDWQYAGLDWSDWSHHEDTDVTDSSVLDINADFNLYGNNKTQLSMLVGFKEETWAWQSRGGTYIHSDTDNNGYRDEIGSWPPGVALINYEQRFKMPYIGLKFESQLNKWKINLQYNYSNQVNVADTDHHIPNGLIFESDFEIGTMSAYKIGLGYQFSQNFDGYIRYDVQDYKEVRGNTTYIDPYTGAFLGRCVNCAGADNSNQTLSVGVSFLY